MTFLAELQLPPVLAQQLPVGAVHLLDGLADLGTVETSGSATPQHFHPAWRGAGWWSRGAHLGPGAAQGLLEKQREVTDLTLQAVVVVGEGAQRRLQCQQVGPDTCRHQAG